MYALSSRDLLELWEDGRGRSHVERGLLLLRAACPELDRDACLDMPVGQRDAHLLAIRTATFGRDAALLATCRRCDERLEFELPLGELCDNVEPATDTCSLQHGAYFVRFRLPTSRDLWSLRSSFAAQDLVRAARDLASRCVIEVEGDCLPDALLEAIADEMQRVDPRAFITASLTCPACNYAFAEPLDLLSCMWSELSAHAVRILHEVHALASRYGWDEAAVLSLSPLRRRLYLEMASA